MWGFMMLKSIFHISDNILLIDNENQSTKIVFPYAKSLLEVTENDAIADLANKVDDLLRSAFDAIK